MFRMDVVIHEVEVEPRLGSGYQAVCSCGWQGMLRTGNPAPTVAAQDAREHEEAAR